MNEKGGRQGGLLAWILWAPAIPAPLLNTVSDYPIVENVEIGPKAGDF